MILENGKPYPDTRYRHNEGLTIVPTDTSFFLLAIITRLSDAEIAAWKEGAMRYGIFVSSGVPFFLLDFPTVKMTLDAPFNALKLDTQISLSWATENRDANLLHMVLVEQSNFIIRAQRAIGIQQEVTSMLKEAAALQLASGDSARVIDERTRLITRTFTTDAMIAAGKMYTL